MNEHQLRCFVAAANYLNFTRAAQEMFMTQAAITYQINELEKSLGIALFSREKGKLELTDAGAVFLVQAQALLERMETAKIAAHQAANERGGCLSIATFGDVMTPFLPRVLEQFRAHMPYTKVTLEQGLARNIVHRIHQGDIDVGFMTGYGGYIETLTWLTKIPIMKDSHVAVMRPDHPLAKRDSVTFDEVNAFTQVLLSEEDLLEREPNRQNFAGNQIILRDPQSVQVLVRAGYGMCICVSHVRLLSDDQLVSVPIKDSEMEIFACYRNHGVSASLMQFMETIEECLPFVWSSTQPEQGV